jgi:hypothetical protein
MGLSNSLYTFNTLHACLIIMYVFNLYIYVCVWILFFLCPIQALFFKGFFKKVFFVSLEVGA